MTKKSKKPKDDLIQSMLEDLKKIPDDSIKIGPDGIDGAEIESDLDSTAALGEDYSSHNENSFLVDESLVGVKDSRNDKASIENPTATLNVSSMDESDPSSISKKTEKKPSVDSKKIKAPQKSEPPLADDKSDDRTMVLDEHSEPVSQSLPSTSSETRRPVQTPAVQEEPNEETVLATPRRKSSQPVETKVSYGGGKGKASPFEIQFAQAEHLKLAQQRIIELEKEMDRLRKENEVLSSAAEISRHRMDELVSQVHQLEKQKHELREVNESELQIFKEGLAAKDAEILRLRNKVEELESRLSNDLRKVRVRERELENRLELSKAEKAALLRAKDENILELKRKTENLETEIENYQNKIIELGQKIESNQDQFARTVRALRLALTNLEVSDGTSPSITLAPMKKAE